MAKPKKTPKKPAIANAGKVSVVPETVKIKKTPATKPVVTKEPVATKAPIVKAASATKGKKSVKAKGGKKQAFKSEPHRAHPPDSEKRNYMLLDTDHNDIGKYTGKSPRQAALKIANTGVVNIAIRETGKRRTRKTAEGNVVEYKIHYFTGSRIQRAKLDKDPDWMPAMINIPKVEKLGSEWIPIGT